MDLLGSSRFGKVILVGDELKLQSTIVQLAADSEGYSAIYWNSLPEAYRDELIQQCVDKLQAKVNLYG